MNILRLFCDKESTQQEKGLPLECASMLMCVVHFGSYWILLY